VPDNIDPKRTSEPPIIDPSGRIKTPEEIEASKRTEQDRQDQDYKQLLLDAETRQANAQHAQARASRAIVILTGGLVIVSLISGFVSYLQFKAADRNAKTAEDQAFITALTVGQTQHMVGQSIEQTRAAEVSAGAAKNSADTARAALRQAAISVELLQQSNQINHDALVSVQRAFLTFEGFGITGTVASAADKSKVESWTFADECENSGVTPAINVRHWNNVITPGSPLPDSFDFKDVGPDQRAITNVVGVGPTLIGPRAKKVLFQVLEPASILQAVKERRTCLYFYGWVTYNDIFKDTKTHITRYCQQVEIVSGNPIDSSVGSGFAFSVPEVCLHYACMDAQCK
jgi:hypothetical protein